MAAAPGKLKLAVDRMRFRMEEEHYPSSRVYLTASRFGAWRPVHDWHVYIANVGQFGCFPRVSLIIFVAGLIATYGEQITMRP